MKKQRRLQIVFSAAVASGQLLSSISAHDQPLRPATARLRAVPEVQYVQPVAYSPEDGEQSTTVDRELQKLFQANGQQQASSGSNIQLVQMSENSGRRTSSRSTGRRKTGFFRRLFGSSNNKQIPGVGEPAPPIPRPPQITYDTNTRDPRNTRVPARTASQSRTAQSVVSGFKAVDRPQQAGGSIVDLDTILGDRRKPGTSVEFIDPFESQVLTSEEETLLDLDSLIEEPTSIATPQKNAAQVVSQTRSLNTPLATTGEAIDNKTQAGPFSDYKQDVEQEQPVGKVAEEAVARQLPRIVPQQERVRTESTQVLEQATRELPAVVKAAAPEAVVNAVPLLKEPDMQLPIVESDVESDVEDSAVDMIPLLEEEDVSVSLPPIQEATVATASPSESAEVAEVARTVTREPAAQRQTHADKVRDLESQARREQQAYRIMARTGKTGFKGFCPVTLRDSRELIDSRPEYRAKFGLQTYYFSSPEAKTAFEANPTRYAPAAGGSDIVLLVNTSEEEPGSLDFSLWYRDRLYLFRSRETRRIFADNPTQYANQY